MCSVFVEAGLDRTIFVQVVTKQVSVPFVRREFESVAEFIQDAETSTYDETGLPYRISTCQVGSGDEYCKLAISHVLDDGSSLQVLCRDVVQAYDERLPLQDAPFYSDFITYVRSQPVGVVLSFWKNCLDGVEPCRFPAPNTPTSTPIQSLCIA
jgi:hypothetical protein